MSSFVTISRNGGSHRGRRRLSFLMMLAVTAVGLFAPLDSLVVQSHAVAITNCNGCHGYGSPIGTFADGTARNTPNGQFPGSHGTHVNQYGNLCSDCHVIPVTISTIDNDHANQLIEMKSPINSNAGAYYKSLTTTAWSRTNTPTFGTCQNSYCHSPGTSIATGVIVTNSSPLWGTIAAGCATCHGVGGAADGRPFYTSGSPKMNDHQAATHLAQTCDVCHDSVTYSAGTYTPVTSIHNNSAYNIRASMGYIFTTTGGTCSTSGCHGAGKWGVTVFDCVTCHSSAINISKGPLGSTGIQRRAVSTEFINTWSHTRSYGFTSISQIPKAICVACHMEGDPASGSPMASYHANGYVELRDPDTGLTIQNVAWVTGPLTTTPGGGWYTNTGTPLNTMARFLRNLNTSTLEAQTVSVQINHCLKCHDSNGAMNTLARVGLSAGNAVTPFGTTIKGFGSTPNAGGYWGTFITANGAAGGVVDVSSAFNVTNSSFHPVKGKMNNPFTWGTMMAAPWNGLTKPITTSNTQWGNLMSCWDCHSGAGATGVQNATVTAHGGPATLRAPIYSIGTTSTTNLCYVCHGRNYNLSASNHVAPSGFRSSGNSGMGVYMRTQCWYCHSSSTTSPARPRRSEDVHGFNRIWTTNNYASTSDQRWPTGATETSRPFSFIRNTTTPALSNHRPFKSPDTAPGTASCTGLNTGVCGDPMGSYTIGGSY